MSSDLKSSIAFLENTNNPANAYFSYTVDDTGEYGVISANKEGLRLYAAELLKKSEMLEDHPDGSPLLFDHMEWVVNEAGYDLIIGVLPQYQTRNEIISMLSAPPARHNHNLVSAPVLRPRLSLLGRLNAAIHGFTGGVIFLLKGFWSK
jgi:hypothetical protein